MKTKIHERLESGILIADGAMGTMLQAAGLPIGECPEAWNITHPEVVTSIHRAYFDAGCDFVLTNTFGGNRSRLAHFGFEGRVREFNRAGARIAVGTKPAGGFVGGSVGPTGEFLEPFGTFTFEMLVEVFAEQISALVEGGVDVICIETISDPAEGKAAIAAAKQVCSLPITATMTFMSGPAGYRTMMGCDAQTGVRQLHDAGADVIGCNCGEGVTEAIDILREMRATLPTARLIAKPNAGLPQQAEGKIVYPITPLQMAECLREAQAIGVSIVGGCCGTTPEHLRQIARQMGKSAN